MRVKQRRHRMHANPFTVRHDIAPPDWPQIFGREAPLALDIGFGPGSYLVELARRHPEWNVIGFEIRQHFVEMASARATSLGLRNMHAMLANANLHLDALIPDGSLVFVSVNFPDPWFKHRHHKRRVINEAWLPVLLRKVQPRGELHFMTDYEVLGRETASLLERQSTLHNLDGPGSFATSSTTGIETEREIKHLGRGEPVFRLRYRYMPAPLVDRDA